MRNPLKRILGGSALAVALVIGAGIAPANAATINAGPVITVKGHVTDPAGDPIAGIKVQSDCGCGFDSPQAIPSHYSGKDTTSKTGYYSYQVRKSVALNISFIDPDKTYLSATHDDATTKTTAGGYTINATLSKASELAGTVRDNNGNPVAGVDVAVYDAATGKAVTAFESDTNDAGRFHALLNDGTYKLKFKAPGYYYGDSWYGGAQLKADAATVTVGYGAKVAGVNGVVQVKPSINGTLTVDGKEPIQGTSDKAVIDLISPAGVLVTERVTDRNFSFVDLAHGSNPVGLEPGEYTMNITPSPKGSAYFTPVSQKVYLAPATDIRGLVINLTTIPATSADKRSALVQLTDATKGTQAIGKAYRTTISVTSYGSTAGGTVTIYIGAKKVATRTLNAAGKANWSTRFTGIGAGTHSIRIAYSGTATTDPRKSFVGQVFL